MIELDNCLKFLFESCGIVDRDERTHTVTCVRRRARGLRGGEARPGDEAVGRGWPSGCAYYS